MQLPFPLGRLTPKPPMCTGPRGGGLACARRRPGAGRCLTITDHIARVERAPFTPGRVPILRFGVYRQVARYRTSAARFRERRFLGRDPEKAQIQADSRAGDGFTRLSPRKRITDPLTSLA